jgi:hypothetical protein
MSENVSNVTGSGNTVLQDISAGGDVNITIADGLPPEVKQKKEALKASVQAIAGELAALNEQATAETELPAFEPPDDPAYVKIKWRRLLNSIRAQTCVLFIGPEISISSAGKSIHNEFYKEIAGEFSNVEFLDKEGFFSPGADSKIYTEMLLYYKEDFPRENKIGRKLLEDFARLPFSLIISLCPDDTIHRVLNDVGIDHTFISYDGTKQDVEAPSKEKPVVYNLIGNAAKDGKYIFTHENFYEYLKNIKIPDEIKKMVKSPLDFLFIGFDFSKWYNRLLLFILGFEQIESDTRFIIENKTVEQDVEMFINDQFKITFVENDNARFVEWLMKNAAQKGIEKIVEQTFLENNVKVLKAIGNQITDKNKMDELSLVEKETRALELKVEKFKKRVITT